MRARLRCTPRAARDLARLPRVREPVGGASRGTARALLRQVTHAGRWPADLTRRGRHEHARLAAQPRCGAALVGGVCELARGAVATGVGTRTIRGTAIAVLCARALSTGKSKPTRPPSSVMCSKKSPGRMAKAAAKYSIITRCCSINVPRSCWSNREFGPISDDAKQMCRSKSVRLWSTSADSGRLRAGVHSGKVCSTFANFGPNLVDAGHIMLPKSVEVGPNLVDSAPNCRGWSNLSHMWPHPKFDRRRPAAVPFHTSSSRLQPKLGEFERSWPGSGKNIGKRFKELQSPRPRTMIEQCSARAQEKAAAEYLIWINDCASVGDVRPNSAQVGAIGAKLHELWSCWRTCNGNGKS